MTETQDSECPPGTRHRSDGSTMERWASFVRPFDPRDPCEQCGRGSCDSDLAEQRSTTLSGNGPRVMKGGDGNRDDDFLFASRSHATHEGIAHEQIQPQLSNVDGFDWADKDGGRENGTLCSAGESLSDKSLAHSYVATPDAYKGVTEDMVGLGSGRVPKRHFSQRQRIVRSQSFADRLRAYSADRTPRSGLKREAVRLSTMPSLPRSAYRMTTPSASSTQQQQQQQQQQYTDVAQGIKRPVAGNRGTLDSYKLNTGTKPPPSSDLVTWNGPKDPDHPFNWPTHKRVTSTGLLLGMVFCVAHASSTLATARSSVSREFETSQEVALLASTLAVLGLAIGAPLWGFISDLYGRKVSILFAFAIFTIFNIPVGLAEDLQTLLAFRFFLGIFGAGPMATVPLYILDVWRSAARGVAMSIFNATCVIGFIAGAVSGGCLEVEPSLGWRWTTLVTVGLSILCGLPAAFLHCETSARIILQRKARTLRLVTNDWALHAYTEESGPQLRPHMATSIRILKDPAFIMPTIHMAFAEGCLYLLFVPYEVSFHSTRGWPLPLDILTLLPVALGSIIGVLINFVITRKQYPNHSKTLSPEARLTPMIIGSWLLPAGLLVFGWTSPRQVSFVPDIAAGIPIGIGISLIMIGGLNYIADSYREMACPAVGANTLVRLVFAFSFPLFAPRMYAKLGVAWANSTLAFVAIVLASIPILLLKFGHLLKRAGKVSSKDEENQIDGQ